MVIQPLSAHVIKPNFYLMLPLTFLPESLKDLIRFLRRDDTTCEIRRQLGYSEVLQNVSLTVTITYFNLTVFLLYVKIIKKLLCKVRCL